MASPYGADYDNSRLGGPDGLRYPLEAGKGTFIIKKEVDLGSVSGTINLNPQQAGASLITLTPSAAVTLVFPITQPGHETLIQNNSATYAVTVEVSGNTTNTAVVAPSTLALVVQLGTNSGVAGNVVVGAGQTPTTYITATGAIPLVSGTYILNGTAACLMTLATPTTPAQDGIVLTIIAGTAHAHTVTTAANKIVPSKDTVTYAAVGDYIILQSQGGLWINMGIGGPTPASLSEV